jgi:cytochrome c553
MRSYLLLLLLGVSLMACETAEKTETAEKPATAGKVEDAKPMALMMRAIYDQSRNMRTELEAGKNLDSSLYRFMEFHKLEPTDSTVLVDVFYQHNDKFREAYENLLRSSDKPAYNAMLTACVNCHADFCPGPIKRINKLRFEES